MGRSAFEIKPLENSVGNAKKVQSEIGGKKQLPTELFTDDLDDWRFEIKRKDRDAGRKNSGSTARQKHYYWVVRVNRETGQVVYYGTLDILDEQNPERLEKYWKRSKKVKNGRTRK